MTIQSTFSNPFNIKHWAQITPLLHFQQSPGEWQFSFSFHSENSYFFFHLFGTVSLKYVLSYYLMCILLMTPKLENCLFGCHLPDLPELKAHNRCLIAYLSIDYLSKSQLKCDTYNTTLLFCTTNIHACCKIDLWSPYAFS